MKTYKINWSRDDYGYILMQAETLEQARELFESGEFKNEDLELKGWNMIINDIKELE